ncbi:MAG TPA: nuclear transport factor 2 family protein [Acidimicrobiales bacterium]|nr:nuclear transport factor 2 family protein [Acidimicrobiales bacterium]
MTSNVEIVDIVSDAIAGGDALMIMGWVSRDICWTAQAADREAAPWFGVYRGKRELLDLFAAFTTVEYTEVTRKAIVAQDDLVMTWVHVAFVGPTGRDAETDEVLIWRFADGKIVSVDVLFDTAAIAAAFA